MFNLSSMVSVDRQFDPSLAPSPSSSNTESRKQASLFLFFAIRLVAKTYSNKHKHGEGEVWWPWTEPGIPNKMSLWLNHLTVTTGGLNILLQLGKRRINILSIEHTTLRQAKWSIFGNTQKLSNRRMSNMKIARKNQWEIATV